MAHLLFYLAIICSMLSQLPALLQNGIDTYLKMSWLLPLGYLTIFYPSTLFNKKIAFFFLFVLVFFLYCSLCECFTGITYVGADIYNIAISCAVTLISFAFWTKYKSSTNIKIIAVIVLICALFLSFIIYRDFLAQVSILQRTYAFQAKNSMGTLLLASLIIAIVCYIPHRLWAKIIYFIALILISIIMFMMKSRATIAGFFFVVAYYLIKYNNKRVRKISLLITLLIIGYIFLNDEAYNVVINGILLGGRSGSIDDVSSGRITLLNNYIKYIPDNLFFGIGEKYLDCFPIIMVVQYGVIGAGIVFFFLWKVARFITFKLDRSINVNLATFLLFWSFMINSLFEAQPPFGPGAKCFLLWMMFGFSLSQFLPNLQKCNAE